MEVLVPGKVLRLGDVPPGGVIGFFDGGQYVRFLRTAAENAEQDHVAIVSLGPFVDSDFAAHVKGPTVYFWDADDKVVYEEKTLMMPKLDTAVEPGTQHIKLGSIVMSKTGETCLQCRTPRGGRALVALSSGETIRDNSAVVVYEQYMLVTRDEEPKVRPIFDSSTELTIVSTAA
jgi:hypothetical protein